MPEASNWQRRTPSQTFSTRSSRPTFSRSSTTPTTTLALPQSWLQLRSVTLSVSVLLATAQAVSLPVVQPAHCLLRRLCCVPTLRPTPTVQLHLLAATKKTAELRGVTHPPRPRSTTTPTHTTPTRQRSCTSSTLSTTSSNNKVAHQAVHPATLCALRPSTAGTACLSRWPTCTTTQVTLTTRTVRLNRRPELRLVARPVASSAATTSTPSLMVLLLQHLHLA